MARKKDRTVKGKTKPQRKVVIKDTINKEQARAKRLGKAGTDITEKQASRVIESAPRKTATNFQTTIQGDTFDINKSISSQDFSSAESFEQAKRIRATRNFAGETPEQQRQAAAAAVAEADLAAQEQGVNDPLPQRQDLSGNVFEGVIPEAPTNEEILADPSARLSPGENLFNVFKDKAVIGPALRAFANVAVLDQLPPDQLAALFTNEEVIDSVRKQALFDIQEETFKKGLDADDRFGVFVESVPFVGSKVGTFSNGLVSTPAGNANTAVTEIQNEKSRARAMKREVKEETLNVEDAEAEIAAMEKNFAKLEARLILLVQASPVLKADGDQVNRIESELIETKQSIRGVKIALDQERRKQLVQ